MFSVEVKGGEAVEVSAVSEHVGVAQFFQHGQGGVTVHVSGADGDGGVLGIDGCEECGGGGGAAAVMSDFKEIGVQAAFGQHAALAGGFGIAFEQGGCPLVAQLQDE